MAKNTSVWLIVLLLVGGILAFNAGMFEGLFSAGEGVDDLYPSDLKTTVTLNTGDKLATSATDANVSYYVFTSSGKFLDDGSTTSGTDSFTVPTGGNYQILLYEDDDSSPDYLAHVESFSTDGESPEDRAVSTVNVDLLKESNATIELVRDPVDLDGNVSTGAGQTVKFDVLVSSTTSKAAVKEPVIRVEVNSSSIESVSINGLSEVDCPDRISTAENRVAHCFKYDDNIEAGDGIVTFSGYLVCDAATAPSSTDYAKFTVMDTAVYLEPDFKTKGFSAVQYGTENPVDNSDIGAGDSQAEDSTDHADTKAYLYYGG